MDIEKAIYLNTLQAAEGTARSVRLVSSYAAGRESGGIRFMMKGRGTARFCAEYRSLAEPATLSLDGKIVAVTMRHYSEIELCLDKGEHLFVAESSDANGGLTLSVEGFGITKNAPYIDRVGGTFSPSECVVYLKRGNGSVEKCVYDGSTITFTPRNERFYDEAYLYDTGEETYLSTKRYCYAGRDNFTVYNGISTVFSHDNVRSLAMCDKRTLVGADYLVAFVDKIGALRFMRVFDGVILSSSDLSAKVADARRVVSAARGSIFLVEGSDHGWTAYYFHSQGESSLEIGGISYLYDKIDVGKTGGVAPSATIDADGAPVLYYRKEDGRLMRRGIESGAVLVAYAEAYHAAASGGLVQVDGEVMPCDL